MLLLVFGNGFFVFCIAMENNPDVVYITQASNELKQTTNDIKRATSILRNKFASFHLY